MTAQEILVRVRAIGATLEQYWAATDPEEMGDLYADVRAQIDTLIEELNQ